MPLGGGARVSPASGSGASAGGGAIGFGAATAGTKATRIPTTGNRGMLGKRQGGERDGEPGHVEGMGNRHGDECNEPRPATIHSGRRHGSGR